MNRRCFLKSVVGFVFVAPAVKGIQEVTVKRINNTPREMDFLVKNPQDIRQLLAHGWGVPSSFKPVTLDARPLYLNIEFDDC